MTIDQRDRVLELLDSGSTYLVVTHENPTATPSVRRWP
jgi:uncharacterized protein YerC